MECSTEFSLGPFPCKEELGWERGANCPWENSDENEVLDRIDPGAVCLWGELG
jgi:hypothetical protein